MLKHLQTAHPRNLRDHKEELRSKQQSKLPPDQRTLDKNGSMVAVVESKEPFWNQDKILSSIVKNLCGRGGLPVCTVEQHWFRDFMGLVEPKFANVSRVAVCSKVDELYQQEKRNLLAEIETSDVDKPTVTVDFWTGCNTKSYWGQLCTTFMKVS